MSRLRIAGGRVVDPANGVDGEADVWIEDGRVVPPPSDPDIRADRTIDARGFVVMPAGVDVHCHIAGPKVDAARTLRPEEARLGAMRRSTAPGSRSGTLGSVPSSFTTGAKYAGLGYGTAVDAAIAPLGARPAHHEFRDTPIIDKAFLVLLGNNHYAMDRIRQGERDRLRSFVAWLLGATRAFGVKVVNPGGVETWKQGGGNVATLDDVVPHFEVTPRQIMTEIARAVDDLRLPHPMHLHGLNLGLPGNAATTMETLRALDGHRAHLAHIQFHSYGGQPGDLARFDSQVGPLAEYVNAHPDLTVDVGQILFGETTSMTADAAAGQFLQRITGRKWVNHDVELETGCGIVPITFDDKNAVHALQWAIGLEWYLRVYDPWRIAMSTDHPNGGSFLAYPQIIALLMDRGHRLDTLNRLPEKVRTRSGLGDLSREYTLSEIAIITRAGPARMLGLSHKGHLGIGADGDVTIYAPDDDKERMFSLPRYLIKAGEVVLDDGDLRRWPGGRTLHVAPEADPDDKADIADWFERLSLIAFANYPVRDEEVANASIVPVGAGGASLVTTINGVAIADTFAEAFPMTAARAIITADSPSWAEIAGRTMTGYATSVIACDAEAAIERALSPDETPDGRPGVSVLAFAFNRDALEKALSNRVGQCVMTCPTTACYNGLPVGEKTVNVGGRLRFFGDGWQIAKRLEGRRFWRVPVMDGEFTCEETFGTTKGVAGGNIILLGTDPRLTLAATEAAVAAMRQVPGVILPFPGGIARSGSKVGSKYKALRASTNTAFAPTLRGLVPSDLPPGVECAYEIVIDGLTLEAVEKATAVGLRAGAGPGVVQISAGNYGGKLGPFHIRLLDVLGRH